MESKLTEAELEILTIRRFFKKDKVDRYVGFVSKPALRPKFIAKLAHFKDLNYDKFRLAVPNETDLILAAAKRLGVNTCYAISENNRIDGQFLDIYKAIGETIGYQMGTLLVFGSAEAVYYEGEEMKDRWISI